MSGDVADRFVMDLGAGGGVYPFVEDENANLTGYGHQDIEGFAREVDRFDRETVGVEVPPTDRCDPAEVVHRWVTIDADGETLTACPSRCPGAIPVTTLWGVR